MHKILNVFLLVFLLGYAQANQAQTIKKYTNRLENTLVKVEKDGKPVNTFANGPHYLREGSYKTSSSYFTEVTLANFISGDLTHTMEVHFNNREGEIYTGILSYPANTDGPPPKKVRGKMDVISDISFLIHEQGQSMVIEFYDQGDFAGVLFIGHKDKAVLKKEANDFEIPGSESNGMYLGEVQRREAGRIVLSKTDHLFHNNKGPFALKEFTIGDKLYARAFYTRIKPPVEILQIEGFRIRRGSSRVKIINEFYLDGKLAVYNEEGPFHDKDKDMINSCTSNREPVFILKNEGIEGKFMEYVLKKNLPSKKYGFEWKKYVALPDSSHTASAKVLLATTGPIAFNITDEGLKKLCPTEFGPPVEPIYTDRKARKLLNVLKKYAKSQGWMQTFTKNAISNKTIWTKVYDAFNNYTHSKCSATFRTEHPLENDRKSFGMISALFHKYPNGSIEVFSTYGQKYIPRVCKQDLSDERHP